MVISDQTLPSEKLKDSAGKIYEGRVQTEMENRRGNTQEEEKKWN